MDRSEWRFRIGSVLMLFGALIYAAMQFAPFSYEKMQGVSFGLLAALFLFYFYTLLRKGWDAAESAYDGGLIVVTLIVCALLTTQF